MIINLFVVVFSLKGLHNILFSNDGLQNSIKWIIFSFILGYRTFTIIPGLMIHPIEVFTYAAILRVMAFRETKYYNMPVSITLLGMFFVLTLIIDCLSRFHIFVILEFKSAFILYLLFFLMQYIYLTERYLKQTLKVYLVMGSLISVLGICEYIFPSTVSLIFNFQSQNQFSNEGSSFHRLAFLFWGTHLAANLIPPVFPILLFLKAKKDRITANNYVLTFLILVNLFSIYLSGNRISWLNLTVMLLLTIIHYKNQLLPKLKPYILILITAFIVYIYSQPVEGRYFSIFKALTGQIDQKYDSSGANRMAKARMALESIKSNPLGTGWSSQGWVHSDLLQISSTIGIIPGIIFLYSLISSFLKLLIKYIQLESVENTSLFIGSCLMVYILVSLILNGNILIVQCGAPLVLLWALFSGYSQCWIQVVSATLYDSPKNT